MSMFSPIPEILEDLKAGKMIVLVDDEDRENEGDLVVAAEKVTPRPSISSSPKPAGWFAWRSPASTATGCVCIPSAD